MRKYILLFLTLLIISMPALTSFSSEEAELMEQIKIESGLITGTEIGES